jgi:hypothetical protein
MKFSTLICLLVLLILSAACGKSGSKKSGKKYTRISPEQIQYIMDNQYMRCGAIGLGTCPQGVSRLLTLNPEAAEKSSVCSGFMVSPTLLVTNHHCIENQAECNNTHIAVYQGSTRNYLQTKCKTIVRTEQDYDNADDPRRRIDYTVLEVADTYSGTFFDLSTARAVVPDSVTAWVIDHIGLDDPIQPNLYESRITEFDCQVLSTSDSTSLMLSNCPVISGNSGSPALNTSGEIIGVIWGATEPNVSSQTDLVTRRAGTGEAAVSEMIHFEDLIP